MINTDKALGILRSRYPDVTAATDNVFRCVDTHGGKPYAVRYFDLRDEVHAAAPRLQQYLDDLLGASYYAVGGSSDLRWNHYVYFVASASRFADREFQSARSVIEANREYARKIVVAEEHLEAMIARATFGDSTSSALPPDAIAIWASVLEQHALSYVVDESLQVPVVVKHIADGDRQGVARVPSAPPLEAAEAAASSAILKTLQIDGFRAHPRRRTFDFGRVNLISGVNGVGKTSLLEAIEFLFCGQTRRTEKAPAARTTIRGTWTGSGETLTTSDTTTKDRLRARHLAWYGKSELRTVTLGQSFGKFNFLDTDAAVHLTIESSRERLTKDLFSLLLGSESSKAMDRLQRVTRQLEDMRKNLEREVVAIDLRRAEAVRRAEEIRSVRQQSDELFNVLSTALRRVGWRQRPVGKREIADLGEALQATVKNIRMLASPGSPIPTSSSLNAAALAMRAVAKMLAEERDRMATLDAGERAAQAANQEANSRLVALESLGPLLASDINGLSQRRDVLKRQHAELSARLRTWEACAAAIPSELVNSRFGVVETVKRWEALASEASNAERSVQAALVALEKAQAAITNARQQLRSAALQLMRHTHDDNHCPVCRTAFAKEELSVHLAQLESGGAAVEAERLRSNVEAAAQLQQQRTRELNALHALAKCDGMQRQSTFAAVADAIEAARKAAESAGSELAVLERRIQEFDANGWNVLRLEELCVAAGFADSAVSSGAVEEMRQKVMKEREAIAPRLIALQRERKESEERIATLAGANSLTAPSLRGMLQEVTERLLALEASGKAIRDVELRLEPQASESAMGVDVQLTQAHDVLMRLRTASEQETQRGDAVARQEKVAADSGAEISALRIRMERVGEAHRVIEELLKTQSERVLVERVLRENAATIAATFARIHAPNEFDVGEEEGLQIVRRNGRGAVGLEEMSSGQRAAYALSLFLAMNARLVTGPRLLMFDDPVSHVDDINTLAFLDHMRDIALTGSRQVFFATADSKIAGLFQRKFGFLGEEFRHIVLTRESE